MRHGKPVLHQSGWIAPAEMAYWIEHYNLSKVKTEGAPIASLQLAELWRFPRLPPSVWVLFFRLLWLLGYSRGADSIRVTKIRAKSAAHKLIALTKNGTVLLVGHGIMNRLIAKELNALGWAGPKKQESHFWGASVHELQTQYCGQEEEALHPYHKITQPKKAS